MFILLMKTLLQKFSGAVLLFILFFIPNVSFSQLQVNHAELDLAVNHEYDLASIFGEEWMQDNPEAVEAFNYCLANRISYKLEPLTAGDKYPLLSSFPLMNKYNPEIQPIDYASFNPSTFFPMIYSLPFFSNRTELIRVDGTDYIIVISPIQ